MERAISLYAHAIEAEETDFGEAYRLTTEATFALDPETAENITQKRYLLLLDLAKFYYWKLHLRAEGVNLYSRYSTARSLYWDTKAAGAGWSGGSSDLSLATMGSSWEKPKDFDIFRETPPSAARKEPDTKAHAAERDEVRVSAEKATPSGLEAKPTNPAHTSNSEEPAIDPLAFETQLLKITALLGAGKGPEARTLLDEVVRDLDQRGLADSAHGVRARELLADIQAQQAQQEDPDGPAVGESTGDPAHTGQGLVSGTQEAGTSGRISEAFGPGGALQPLADLLAADPSAGATLGLSPSEVGDILYSAGKFDLASEVYKDAAARSASKDPLDPERLRANLGLARIADTTGQGAGSLSLFEQVINDLRHRYPAGHPLVLEAEERYSRAIREAKGDEAYCALLEDLLADQQRTLGPKHSATQSTRRRLGDAYAERGNTDRALALRVSAFQGQDRATGDGQAFATEADYELVELLDGAGESGAAFDVLQGTWMKSARPTEASVPVDSLREMQAEALRLQSACRLDEALELRRRIVEQERDTLPLDDPERIEGLRDLAALLRVLGRTEEARGVEAQARFQGRMTPEKREQLSRWKAEALANLEGAGAPPLVRLRSTSVDGEGRRTVIVEVEDPAGILALSLIKDLIPRQPSSADGEWTIDPSGTRATLEMHVSLKDQPTVIAVAAENLQHVQGYQSLVVK